MAMKRKLGRPHAIAIALPVTLNGSVTIVAEGRPACSKTILSRTLPDEQAPQSPTPATTASQAFLYSLTISSDGLAPELCFRRMRCD